MIVWEFISIGFLNEVNTQVIYTQYYNSFRIVSMLEDIYHGGAVLVLWYEALDWKIKDYNSHTTNTHLVLLSYHGSLHPALG